MIIVIFQQVDKLKEENAKLLEMQRGKDVPQITKSKDLESVPTARKPGPKPPRPLGNRPFSMFETRAPPKPTPSWKGGSLTGAGAAASSGKAGDSSEAKDAGKGPKSVAFKELATIKDEQPAKTVCFSLHVRLLF